MKQQEREVPVYVFTGLLESGKTVFVRDTLNDKGFQNKEHTLLIVCEEGIEEYDQVAFSKKNVAIEYIESKEQLDADFFEKCERFHQPDRVLIEYNGMWELDVLEEEHLPDTWIVAQVISTVDATTFPMYWNNMRSILMEQLSLSDMIILNRCTDETKRNDFRRSVKLFNRKAQIGYEAAPGFEGMLAEEELPYDIEADVIELEDDDYGIWYMDVMDNPKKYDGKVVKFRGMVYRPKHYPKTSFVPGRFAMTCCADDISFMGIVCKSKEEIPYQDREWILLTAQVKREFVKEYRGRGPVLYLQDVAPAEKPEDDLIYF